MSTQHHNPFVVNPEEITLHWKAARQAIALAEEDLEKINLAVAFWAKAPLMKRAYDIEDYIHIPSPWEMMAANKWCAESVAIGMEFTLRLAGFDKARLELLLIRDYDLSEQLLVVKIDNKYFLNYDFASVVPIPDSNFDIIGRYSYDRRGYRPSADCQG